MIAAAEELMTRDTTEAVALTTWLTLLGWQVDVELDGELFVGAARHTTASGSGLRVGACAATKAAAVWQLFEAVMAKVGAEERPSATPRSRIEASASRRLGGGSTAVTNPA
jgi:hypothetical protein